MKLHLLEKLIDDFLVAQTLSKEVFWYLPHSLVHHFHLHWDRQRADGWKEMINVALSSNISQRWWKREHYRPKEIVLQLMDADPELAIIAFKDLSNDTASLDGRLSRFEYYCNELLQIHRKNHLRSVETYHHQDASIISLYLAGMIPEKYTLYPGLNVFQKFCAAVGSPEIPVVDDLVRYMKVAAIVFTFLQRNPQFETLTQSRISTIHKVHFIPFQTVFEIISFAGGNVRLEIV